MKTIISKVSTLIQKMTRPTSEKMIFAENLPMTVKLFVQSTFPDKAIAYVEEKTTSNCTSYDICLNDGMQMRIKNDGSWELMESVSGTVPTTLVPQSVTDFMNKHYPGIPFYKIEKTGNDYKVTLSNCITLKFDQDVKAA